MTVPTDDPAKLTAPEAGGGVPSDFSLVLGGPLYQLLLRTPEDGNVYKAGIEDGKLKVRDYRGLFYKTQTWVKGN